MSNNVFTYRNDFNEEVNVNFEKGDFDLVQENRVISDQKMLSKPTTFFKDALKRFAKNKSSVLGAIVLGILLVLTIVLPEALPADISSVHPYEKQLASKLFEAGTGWWDGCKTYSHIAVDMDWDKYAETGEVNGLPATVELKNIVNGYDGITYGKVGDEYTDIASPYAHGGYLRLFQDSSYQEGQLAQIASRTKVDKTDVRWSFIELESGSANSYHFALNTENGNSVNEWTYGEMTPSFSVYFSFLNQTTGTTSEIALAEHINTYYNDDKNPLKFDLTKAQIAAVDPAIDTNPIVSNGSVIVRFDEWNNTSAIKNVLIKKLSITGDDETRTKGVAPISIDDANSTVYNGTWFSTHGTMGAFHADIVYCSYRFDTYEAKLGSYTNNSISRETLQSWSNSGYLTADFTKLDTALAKDTKLAQRQKYVDEFIASIQVTDEKHLPLVLDEDHALVGEIVTGSGLTAVSFTGTVIRWKELYPGRDSCPKYLFGTDDYGKDLLKYSFAGLRTSLLLGVCTFVVCFLFGLCWGAISGYFGGWVDIVMERFTEILGGVPWIVVMTLAIILFGQSFLVFAMALCLTGWMGTASITRTQFYRFKDREYILAARTLGASDFRLIFRHVLPNAMGTIITSSVLMIPSVIFSEATLSYLHLGLQGMASFGVMLSENQAFVDKNPTLIIFPSIIMALLMISFNLFGNGLRDAFNPSLKGQD